MLSYRTYPDRTHAAHRLPFTSSTRLLLTVVVAGVVPAGMAQCPDATSPASAFPTRRFRSSTRRRLPPPPMSTRLRRRILQEEQKSAADLRRGVAARGKAARLRRHAHVPDRVAGELEKYPASAAEAEVSTHAEEYDRSLCLRTGCRSLRHRSGAQHQLRHQDRDQSGRDNEQVRWGFGQGAAGYFKRFGASYADTADGNFWGNAVLPVLLKEDPRYYRMGSGSFVRRFLLLGRDRRMVPPRQRHVGTELRQRCRQLYLRRHLESLLSRRRHRL